MAAPSSSQNRLSAPVCRRPRRIGPAPAHKAMTQRPTFGQRLGSDRVVTDTQQRGRPDERDDQDRRDGETWARRGSVGTVHGSSIGEAKPEQRG